jgi:hypothetical protein
MKTKVDILKTFSKQDLIDLSKTFNLNYVGLKKDRLQKNICDNRKITKNLLQLLSERKEKSIQEKFKGIKNDFYENYITKRVEKLDEIKEIESNLLSKIIFSDMDALGKISDINDELLDLGNFDEEIPKEIENNITKKMISSFQTKRKWCYYRSKFLSELINDINSSEIIQEFENLELLKSNDKLYYYLYQSRKCYHVSAFDASIVMIARAIEYAIYTYLNNNKIKVDDKTTLGPLIGLMRKENLEKELIGKVVEVQNWDRNVCAHDGKRHRYGKTEADHSWTAAKLILKELLNVDLQ